MITRGELKGKILRVFNKTPRFQGAYSDAKIADAVEEAMDFIAVEMFLNDEGWLTKLVMLDTVANQISVDLPPTVAMIKEVRILCGDRYSVVTYDAANDADQTTSAAGGPQNGLSYRLIDNALYFNPPLTEGAVNGIQIEHMSYPRRLQDDNEFLESQFDYSMQHFLKYRAASILAATTEKMMVSWSSLEANWYDKMQAIVVKRNQQSQPIRDFEG